MSILAGPIVSCFILVIDGRDVRGGMRNEKSAHIRQIDRDSYLVKSQKPLSGPMREKRVGEYMCYRKEYTLQGRIQKSSK